MPEYYIASRTCILQYSSGAVPGLFSRGEGGGPRFAHNITEIQSLSTFKQMVSNNRVTLFCVFISILSFHFFKFQEGSEPFQGGEVVGPPLDPPMLVILHSLGHVMRVNLLGQGSNNFNQRQTRYIPSSLSKLFLQMFSEFWFQKIG